MSDFSLQLEIWVHFLLYIFLRNLSGKKAFYFLNSFLFQVGLSLRLLYRLYGMPLYFRKRSGVFYKNIISFYYGVVLDLHAVYLSPLYLAQEHAFYSSPLLRKGNVNLRELISNQHTIYEELWVTLHLGCIWLKLPITWFLVGSSVGKVAR